MAAELCKNICVSCNYHQGHLCRQFRHLAEADKELLDLKKKLTEIIARNLTAWDTSKDKKLGLLPEVYCSNKYIYKELTGEEYSFSKAVKNFNI